MRVQLVWTGIFSRCTTCIETVVVRKQYRRLEEKFRLWKCDVEAMEKRITGALRRPPSGFILWTNMALICSLYFIEIKVNEQVFKISQSLRSYRIFSTRKSFDMTNDTLRYTPDYINSNKYSEEINKIISSHKQTMTRKVTGVKHSFQTVDNIEMSLHQTYNLMWAWLMVNSAKRKYSRWHWSDDIDFENCFLW